MKKLKRFTPFQSGKGSRWFGFWLLSLVLVAFLTGCGGPIEIGEEDLPLPAPINPTNPPKDATWDRTVWDRDKWG